MIYKKIIILTSLLLFMIGCQETPNESPYNHDSALEGKIGFEEGAADTISANVKLYYSQENLFITETASNPQGRYNFDNLASGEYQLNFSAPNYEDFSLSNIMLHSGELTIADSVQMSLIKAITIFEATVDGEIDPGWQAVYMNEHESNWGPNDFENLYLARSDDSLYIAVTGEFSADDNTVGIYIDKDYGAGTGLHDFSSISGGEIGDHLRKQVTTVETFGADLAFSSGWGLANSIAVVDLADPQSVDQNILENANYSLNSSTIEFAIAFVDIYEDGEIPFGSKIALVAIIGGGGDEYFANDSIPQPDGDFTGHFTSVFSRQYD